MTNKEKFLALVTEKDTSFLEELNKRKENREMLRESQTIAFKILFRLDELGWSQKDLAEAMKVSPQQINKIVKGTENLTLETQVKLQSVLKIAILASYHEKKEQLMQSTVIIEKKKLTYSLKNRTIANYAHSDKKTRMIKMEFDKATNQCTFKEAI